MVFPKRRGAVACYRHEKSETSQDSAINNSASRARTRSCLDARRPMAATRTRNAFWTRSSKVALELRADAVGAHREYRRLGGVAMITPTIFWALVLALFTTKGEEPRASGFKQ
jgi:hypothetical protein